MFNKLEAHVEVCENEKKQREEASRNASKTIASDLVNQQRPSAVQNYQSARSGNNEAVQDEEYLKAIEMSKKEHAKKSEADAKKLQDEEYLKAIEISKKEQTKQKAVPFGYEEGDFFKNDEPNVFDEFDIFGFDQVKKVKSVYSDDYHLQKVSTDDLFHDKFAALKTFNLCRKTDWIDGCEKIQISRETVIADSMRQIDKVDLMKELKIDFIGEVSHDAGGLIREWFTLCFKELLSPQMGLFIKTETEEHTYIINPCCGPTFTNLEYFRFIGILLGKAIIENIKVNTCFNMLIYKKIFGSEFNWRDARYLDQTIYQSLKNLNSYDLASLDMFYTASIKTANETKEVELIDKGSKIPIKSTEDYLLRLVEFYLDRMEPFTCQIQFALFPIVPKDAFEQFSMHEIRMIINGKGEIDVVDWKKNTYYKGSYSEDHELIKWFWEILGVMSENDKQTFLQFCLGTTRLPIEGFKLNRK